MPCCLYAYFCCSLLLIKAWVCLFCRPCFVLAINYTNYELPVFFPTTTSTVTLFFCLVRVPVCCFLPCCSCSCPLIWSASSRATLSSSLHRPSCKYPVVLLPISKIIISLLQRISKFWSMVVFIGHISVFCYKLLRKKKKKIIQDAF